MLHKPPKSRYLLKHNFLLFPKKRDFLQGYKALFFMIFEIRLIDPGRILTKNNVIFTDKYMVIKHLLLSFGIVYWWTKKLHSNLSFKITISIWRYLKCVYLSVIWKMCMLFRSAEQPRYFFEFIYTLRCVIISGKILVFFFPKILCLVSKFKIC